MTASCGLGRILRYILDILEISCKTASGSVSTGIARADVDMSLFIGVVLMRMALGVVVICDDELMTRRSRGSKH